MAAFSVAPAARRPANTYPRGMGTCARRRCRGTSGAQRASPSLGCAGRSSPRHRAGWNQSDDRSALTSSDAPGVGVALVARPTATAPRLGRTDLPRLPRLPVRAVASARRAPVARRSTGVSGGLQASQFIPRGVQRASEDGPELDYLSGSRLNGAAPESNRPSVGLPRRTGFEGLLPERQSATEAALRLRYTPVACGETR